MIVSSVRRPAVQRRAAFTLLEVLVVVAILVILAAVAGVYVFGYLDDAKIDTAQQTCAMFESQCKAFAVKNDRMPENLGELVVGVNGRNPLVDGGPAALQSPWGGTYELEIGLDANENPDPIVYTIGGKGQRIVSKKRQNMGQ